MAQVELVDSLAVRMRPHKFGDIVGNPANIKLIKGYLQQGKLPRSWLFNGQPGSAKCYVSGTLVSTPKGLFEIQDLVGDVSVGYTEREIEVYTKDGVDTTSHVYKQENCKTIKITTSYGYNVEGTYDHPVYVLNSNLTFCWKKLKDIENGDVICFNKKPLFSQEEVKIPEYKHIFNNHDTAQKAYNIPKKCDKYLARFIGYLIANGTFSRDSITFVTYNKRVQKDFIYVVNKLFGYETEFIKYGDKTPVARISSVYIYNFMKGIMKFGIACEKEIPSCILQSPSGIIKEFLSAYISCDSTIDERSHTSNKNPAPCLYLCTASKKLANQLHIILLHFGAIGNLYAVQASATNSSQPIERTYYEIAFSAYHSKIIFDMLNILKDFNKKDVTLYNEFYPGFIYDEYVKMQKTYGFKTGHYKMAKFDKPVALRAKFGIKLATTSDVFPTCITMKQYEKFCSQYELIKLIDEDLGNKLEKLYNYGFFFDSVIDIKHSKKKKTVYDITLPKTHSFIANGFISHNTTSARILAMAANCENIGENIKKGNPEPCLECTSCKLALQNKHPDIIEINCGGEEGNADGIRNLISSMKLSPRFGVKCFILDECLPADAQVLLADGSTLPISEFEGKFHQKVISYNMETRQVEVDVVTHFRKNLKKGMVELHLADGSSQRCSDKHRWWNNKVQNYVEAHQFNGDLLKIDGTTIGVNMVRYLTEPEDCYDITVQNNHNFFVKVGNNLVLSKNCHLMSSTAKSNLLKPIEEPPKHVMWLLCTTDPDKLPKAALTRCIKLYYEYPSIKETAIKIWDVARSIYPKEVTSKLKPYIKKIATSVSGQMRDSYSIMESLASIIQADPDIDEDELKNEFGAVLTSMGELTTPSIRCITYALSDSFAMPLGILNDIDPSRLNEFLNTLSRHATYAAFYFANKREKTLETMDKKRFYGINFSRFDPALEQIYEKLNKKYSARQIFYKATMLSKNVLEALVKNRQGLLSPEQSLSCALTSYIQDVLTFQLNVTPQE